MPAEFFSDPWARAVCARLAASDAYRAAAAGWHGDMAFVARPGAADDGSSLVSTRAVYLALGQGTCARARAIAPTDADGAAFAITADYAVWQAMLSGRLDPVMGLMLGKLAVRGDRALVLRHARAAKAMVECAAEVETAPPA